MLRLSFPSRPWLIPTLCWLLLPTLALAQSSLPGLVNTQPPSACRAGMRQYESERGLQLLGELIRADFPRLLPGWDAEFATYAPSPVDVAKLAQVEDDITIFCVLGTWCSDSEREVPRFWKILEEADNPNLDLVMFAVGRSSDEKARAVLAEIGFDVPLRQEYDVQLVPTFIFRRGDEELGRIIETPETTLEQDAARILAPAHDEAAQPAWR